MAGRIVYEPLGASDLRIGTSKFLRTMPRGGRRAAEEINFSTFGTRTQAAIPAVPTIAVGASGVFSVAVPGARSTDYAVAVIPDLPEGVFLQVQPGTNVVSVRVGNLGVGPLSLTGVVTVILLPLP